MYPLLTLTSLTSYIEDAVDQVANEELDFGDACSLDSSADDVLVSRDIIR